MQFVPFSNFYLRSGMSMLPTHITVYVMMKGKPKTRLKVGEYGEFIKRRLYLEGIKPKYDSILIELSGAARWFAVCQISILTKSEKCGK